MHAHSIETFVFYFHAPLKHPASFASFVSVSFRRSLLGFIRQLYCQFAKKMSIVAIAFAAVAGSPAISLESKCCFPLSFFVCPVHFLPFLFPIMYVFHRILLASSIALIRFSISMDIYATPWRSVDYLYFLFFLSSCNLFCRAHSMLAILDNYQRKQMKKAKAIPKINE